MKKLLSGLLMVGALIGLSGCSDDEAVDLNTATPTEVIQGFYQAVYEEKDLEKAKRFASPRMVDLISHYAAVSSVQRYVLGRYYDKVELEVVSDSLGDYLNHSDELRATVLFEGEYKGEYNKDSRDVVLIQNGDSWLVDRILDPRYRP
ncbi:MULTISPECIES: hypothetical protein [Idiomarina]|jgi:major membrane immunogen (membrane-anchored lipoprotein)|uniref:DUF3828 domain-containing protein n=1 Tax=Idiomarina zobellii TaxID=86103 RepID=A0A837NAA2_9GAMM|nr:MULTISPECIES: hypothetical protein [Idiomarina]KPD23834.1 hypothetical protein AFK76_06785 [Idiomarina zobellii]MCJ8315505.1 hypothetical protein [Idiomarina sp.]NQZ15420.1 hypothetical protein [Idiomarina sp.]SDF74681.1 hypothetical protein SAMN04515658_10468 [Idiomarina zobellii]